jgi:hypothetical protein
VGRVLGGGVGSEWKGSEDEGEGEHLFRHVQSPILLPFREAFCKLETRRAALNLNNC